MKNAEMMQKLDSMKLNCTYMDLMRGMMDATMTMVMRHIKRYKLNAEQVDALEDVLSEYDGLLLTAISDKESNEAAKGIAIDILKEGIDQ